MDNILLHDTGVQYIEGYSFINYSIYALEPYPLLNRPLISAQQLRCCREGAASIIRRDGLAFCDPCLRCVWVFEKPNGKIGDADGKQPIPTSVTPDNSSTVSPSLVPSVEGASFRSLFSGSLYTPGLGRRKVGTTNLADNSATPSNDQNSSAEPAPSRVYSMFISAVVSSLSYHLARNHSVIPLNFRTFLVSRASPISDCAKPILGADSKCLVSLDVSLSNLGVLIVSFQASASSLWDHLGSPAVRYSCPDASFRLICVAPCGVFGKQYSNANTLPEATDVPEEKRWKTLVTSMLETSGIFLSDLAQDSSWTELWLPKPRIRNGQSYGFRKCWWPTALCFVPLESEAGFSSPVVEFMGSSAYIRDPNDLPTGAETLEGFSSLWMPSLLDEVDVQISTIENATRIPPEPAGSGREGSSGVSASCGQTTSLDANLLSDKGWLSSFYPSPPGEGVSDSNFRDDANDSNSAVSHFDSRCHLDIPFFDPLSIYSPPRGVKTALQNPKPAVGEAQGLQGITPRSFLSGHDDYRLAKESRPSSAIFGGSQESKLPTNFTFCPSLALSSYSSLKHSSSDSADVIANLDAKYRSGGKYGFEVDYKPPLVKNCDDLRLIAKRLMAPQKHAPVLAPTLAEIEERLPEDSDSSESDDSDSGDGFSSVLPKSYLPTHSPTHYRDFRQLDYGPSNYWQDLTVRFFDVLHPDTFSWPLTICPLIDDGAILPLFRENVLSSQEMVAVTQLIAEQHIFSSIAPPNGLLRSSPFPTRSQLAHTFWNVLRKATRELFSERKLCSLLHYLGIHDHIPNVGSITNIKLAMRRIMGLADYPLELSEFVFEIPSPNIRVRRGGSLWDLAASSIPFWDTLGLGPVNGPKNITPVCLVPRMTDRHHSVVPLKDMVRRFLLRLSSSYQACRLGNHASVDEPSSGHGHIVEYSLFPAGPPDDLLSICLAMGERLGSFNIPVSNTSRSGQAPEYIVVYIVDPFETPDSLRQCSIAYHALARHFDTKYSAALGASNLRPTFQLAFQIIPLTFVAECPMPVFGEHDPLARFAREVYSRCSVEDVSSYPQQLGICTSAAVALEEPLPRILSFKGEKMSSSSLYHDHMHLHLGYSRSLDGNWVSAAWTDDSGQYQSTSSYFIGQTRTYRQVLSKMWQTTASIMASSGRTTWRLCIAKLGPLGPGEPDTWRAFTTADSKFSLFLTVVSVDPFPHFSLTSPEVVEGSYGPLPQTGSLPHLSAEQAGCLPSDFAREHVKDSDPVLSDAYDTVWGVVLNRRMRNSYSLLDYRPCLASGMLLGMARTRFGPPGMEHLQTAENSAISVNLVSFWTSGPNPPTPPAPFPNESGEVPRSLCTSGPVPVPASLWASGAGSAGVGAAPASGPPTPTTTHPGGTGGASSSSGSAYFSIQPHASKLRQSFPGGVYFPAGQSSAGSAPTLITSSASTQSQADDPGSGASGGVHSGTAASTAAGGVAHNSVSAPPSSSGHLFLWIDTILRELLVLYRRLAVLGRVRGMIDPSFGLLPWHLIAAMRGANALELSGMMNKATLRATESGLWAQQDGETEEENGEEDNTDDDEDGGFQHHPHGGTGAHAGTVGESNGLVEDDVDMNVPGQGF